MRILILRFSSLGDIVLATAAVHALAEKHPDAELIFATKQEYAPIFENVSARLQVRPLSDSQSVMQYLDSLGDRSFDMIVDLHGSLRSRAIVRRLQSPDIRRVNKNTLKRWRMVWSKKGLDRPLSIVDSYLHVVGADRLEFRPVLHLSQDEQSAVKSLQGGEMFCLGIGWGAKHATKAVPTEIWRNILHTLSGQTGVKVLFFGMPHDETDISRFVKGEVVNLSSVISDTHIGLPLRATMTQIASCDAFLSSDSGLMHVADALGVPTFGLFGPTHPSLGFAPAGERSRAFHAGTWCSPCHRHGSAPCFRERRFCFDELRIDEIVDSVLGARKLPIGRPSE